MTERPQRRRSRLSSVHPAAGHSETPTEVVDEQDPSPAEPREVKQQYESEKSTGRLTIDVNRALRRDLKAWAGEYDGTIADVIRALAKLTLADQDSPGRQACRAAILSEIDERRQREAERRQNG